MMLVGTMPSCRAKVLYIRCTYIHTMAKRKTKSKMTSAELTEAIKEAQKDPQWVREVKKFIKATT